MPEKLEGGVACLCCARPLSKWQFCFINRQMIGFIRSLLYVLKRSFNEKIFTHIENKAEHAVQSYAVELGYLNVEHMLRKCNAI